MSVGEPGYLFALTPLLIWALVWKGWALWLAARRGELPWFIALLVINTVGILEIFYIFVIAKQRDTIEVVATESLEQKKVAEEKEPEEKKE